MTPFDHLDTPRHERAHRHDALAYPADVQALVDAEAERRWLEVATPGTPLEVADDHLVDHLAESLVLTSFASLTPTRHPSCDRPAAYRRGHTDAAAIAWTLEEYEGVQLALHELGAVERGAR